MTYSSDSIAIWQALARNDSTEDKKVRRTIVSNKFKSEMWKWGKLWKLGHNDGFLRVVLSLFLKVSQIDGSSSISQFTNTGTSLEIWYTDRLHLSRCLFIKAEANDKSCHRDFKTPHGNREKPM